MATMAEILAQLNNRVDSRTLEDYIARSWVRPLQRNETWHFETIDVARIELVHQLKENMQVNEAGMEVVLHLLDQLYGLRDRMTMLRHAIERQPGEVRQELLTLLLEMDDDYTTVE